MAYRTRSKLRLVHVPLGRLEAELLAPDVPVDGPGAAQRVEDRHWTKWLQGLMAPDSEGQMYIPVYRAVPRDPRDQNPGAHGLSFLRGS